MTPPGNMIRTSISIVILGMFWLSCKSSEAPEEEPPLMAALRVIHTNYDADAIKIEVDEEVIDSAVAFGEASTYLEVTAGTRKVRILSLSDTSAAGVLVSTENFPAEANRSYTIYVVRDASTVANPVHSTDNRSADPAKATIRFFHAAPDAPALDVKLDSGSGQPLFIGNAFKDLSDFTQLDPGAYSLVITTTASANEELAVLNPLTLNAGMIYTIVAYGTLSNAAVPFRLRVFQDLDPGNDYVDPTEAETSIMGIHTGPDIPGSPLTVDFLVDRTVLNSAPLDFDAHTDYLPVRAGTRNIRFNLSAAPTNIAERDFTLRRGAFYSAFLVGQLPNVDIFILQDDLSGSSAGVAFIRFIHLSPDAPRMDFTFSNGNVIFSDRGFKQATAFLAIAEGVYDFQFRETATPTELVNIRQLTLVEGRFYTIYAKGLQSNSGEQGLDAGVIVNR